MAAARAANGQFIPTGGRTIDVESTRVSRSPRPVAEPRRRGELVVVQMPQGLPAAADSKKKRRRRASIVSAGAAIGAISRTMAANPIPTAIGVGVGAGVQLAIPADRPEGAYVVLGTAGIAYLGRKKLPAPVVAAAAGATLGGAGVLLARRVDTVATAAEWVATRVLEMNDNV